MSPEGVPVALPIPTMEDEGEAGTVSTGAVSPKTIPKTVNVKAARRSFWRMGWAARRVFAPLWDRIGLRVGSWGRAALGRVP